jgi:putative transposase
MPLDNLENMEVKRIFRARQKINAPGIISHITQRAAGAERLFLEEDDYLEMLARLKRISQTHEIDFFAFVLMPNHIHLLLRQGKENLYEAMRELFSRYARRHNHKYERKGRLFGGAYRQAVCLDDAYVLAVSLYIHLNPVRAGLVQQPTDYRWSSCRLFTEPGSIESFVSSATVLDFLSDDTLEAKDIYREMLEEGRKLKMGEIIEDRRAIHDLQWGLAKVIPLIKKLTTLRTAKLGEHWDEADVQERIEAFEKGQYYSMPKEREAKKYLVEQLISRGFTRRDIAQRLGVSRKTIYNLLTRPRKN